MNDRENESIINLREMAGVLYRRWYWMVVPAVLGALAALAASMVITPSYQSSATLLIESQEIPTTLVASPLTQFADERIAKIRQQLVSRANLIRLINAHQLYPGERRHLPLDVVLEQMRRAIKVELVSASGTTEGKQGANTTIAFTLSYAYRNAATAQAVAETLTGMFIREDKRLRTEQASGTAQFLTRRADELRDRLTGLDARRRAIQAHYGGALPEQMALTAQSGATLRAEVSRMDAESQGIGQQNGLLAARAQELAAAPPIGSDTVRAAEAKLDQLTAIYSDDYPDVVAARTALANARAAMARNARPAPGAGLIASEIGAGRDRIAAMAQRRAGLVGQIASMEHTAALAPQASFELNKLERDYDNLKQQYQDIREKQLEANVAANLQAEDKGERFSVVNGASWPTTPVQPNVRKLLSMGVAAGLALGAALVVAWAVLVGPIEGPDAITRLTGVAPLVTIPVLRRGASRGYLPLLPRLSSQRLLPSHR